MLICITCTNDTSDTPVTSNDQLFTLLPAQQTGIVFNNTLKEGLNTNVLMYEYFYNGGGVATGDFNGDDLIDLYFTSNMDDNKFYLKKGDFKFEDITAESGAGGREGPWKTGLALVDINGDNRLDIYLCYSGTLPDRKRMNQLFINQGNDPNGIPKFKDEAAKYGLNSPAFSNQSYFFDYDRDGDLDMLLLNHNPKSLPVLNEVSTEKMMAEDDPLRGLRLFRQDDGIFKDITKQAGIVGSPLSYGLGIGIADFNEDGWADFYVSNDYTIPDYLYINNKNGKFTNKLAESITHNSHFSMGNDVADLNNDGRQDIVTLDMLPEDNERQKLLMAPDNYAKFDLNVRSGFHYQYMRNMLQINNGNGTFSEVGQLAGISNTDWSWAALAADYDNDGWKDLYVTNGYHRDYTNLDFINYMNDFVQKKGRLQRTDVVEIINNMPASDVVNYMFQNDNLQFKNVTKSWGLHHITNSNGAAYADLDNDGDLDLIINNINKPASIFKNEKQGITNNNFLKIKLKGENLNTLGLGAKVAIFYDNQQQKIEQQTSRGYLSAVSPVLHFGLGNYDNIDSLIIIWQNGKSEKLTNIQANQTIILEEKNATARPVLQEKNTPIFSEISSPINYTNPKQTIRDFDRQPLLLCEFSHQGPCMTKGDLNGDGLEDMVIGGSVGEAAKVFLQAKNKKFKAIQNTDFEQDKASEDTAIAIFDANADGHADIYIASGGYNDFTPNDQRLQDRLYLNDGRGNFSKSPDALPKIYESNATLAIGDANADGHLDVYVGARVQPGAYPQAPASALLVNDGTGKFTNKIAELAPELERYGMVTDAAWVDVNGDEKQDLVVVGEWLPVSVFVNEGGKLTNRTDEYFDKKYNGFWRTLEVADINKDGKPDLIAGNIGDNTQFKISDAAPAEMYYKDFDENGSIDPLFCFYIQGKKYPYLTRDELIKQLAPLRSQYTNYQSFATASMTDIFPKTTLNEAKILKINHTKTTLFLSNSNGKFTTQKLPIEAQYAPVNAIQILDFDQDGNQDLLLCGNESHAKLRLGSLTANYGFLLRGDGVGAFDYVPQIESGFALRGDVRDVILIDDVLFFGINQGELVVYKLK